MEINILYRTPRSVTLEIDDGGIYTTHEGYELVLTPDRHISGGSLTDAVGDMRNGLVDTGVNPVPTEVRLHDRRCVISVFGLIPSTEYEIDVKFDVDGIASEDGPEVSGSFTTKAESVTLNVRDFGALGDGEHNDTAFIQAAIMTCPAAGRVLIPAGRYLITGLFLRSDMYMEIAKGAELVFDNRRENIPRFPGRIDAGTEVEDYFLGSWEGEPKPMYNGIISAIGVTTCGVYGEGTINGNASRENWWLNPKEIGTASRPRTIFIKSSDHVYFQGLRIINSPSWTIHPFMSKKLGFFSLDICNPCDSPNTDGIDPEGCEHVDIAGVHFSLGDDCIAIKSGKIEMGKRFKMPSQTLHIFQCYMEHGHGAVTIGSEAAAGVRRLLVEKCRFKDTDRGLRVKTRRGRGKDSIMDDIAFRDIEMDGVVTPFVVNSFYFCDEDGKTDYVQNRQPAPVDDRTPEIRRLVFERINAVNSHYCAGWFEGLPEKPIREIDLRDINISFAKDAKKGIPAMALNVPECCKAGFTFLNVDKVEQENVHVEQ